MRRMLVLAAVVVLAAGCRSDGGFGRSSSAHDMSWAASCMANHSGEAWENTKANLAAIGPGIANSFSDSWREMNYTMDLYLENHQSKPGYARYERTQK